MKVLVDADACPVKKNIVTIARRLALPVVMITDTSHQLEDGYSQVITVDKGADSADLVLVNRAQRGDVAVTQDYALASMLLAKGVAVVHQNGFEYTDYNIDRLLFERHIGKKMRRAGKRGGHSRARTPEDDARFNACFEAVCKRLKGE